MSGPLDYPDYRKPVAVTYASASIYSGVGQGAGQVNTGKFDTTGISTLDISGSTANDAAGDIWALVITWYSDAQTVLGTDRYTFIGGPDLNMATPTFDMSVPVRGALASVLMLPTGLGAATVRVYGSTRTIATRRVRAGNFSGGDIGGMLASTSVPAGASAYLYLGTTDRPLAFQLGATSTTLANYLQAYSAYGPIQGWQTVWGAAQSSAATPYQGILVPPQALRFRFANTDTAAHTANATVWEAA